MPRIEQSLATPLANRLLLALLAIIYTLAYLGHPALPGNMSGHPEAWIGWWDQGHYYKAAWAISRLSLDATTYWYPPGYSALAAPFAHFTRNHAFFIPNIALTLLSTISLYKISIRYLSRLETLFILAVLMATHQWLLAQTQVVPWNTIPTQAVYLLSILILLTTKDARAVYLLSTLAAITYLIRPADAVLLAPILVYSTLRLHQWRCRFRVGAAGASIVLVSVLLLAVLNKYIFNSWLSPYDVASREIGFFSFPLSLKAYWLLIDGLPFYNESTPAILFRYPWLPLTPVTLVYWVRKDGLPALAAVGTLIASILFYLSYNDLSPSNIYRFSLIHYLSWALILLFPLTYAAITRGWKVRALRPLLALSPCLVVLPLCIAVKPRFLPTPPTVATSDGKSISFHLPPHSVIVVRYKAEPFSTQDPILKRNDQKLRKYADYNTPFQPDQSVCLAAHPEPSTVQLQVPGAVLTDDTRLLCFEWTWRPEPARAPWLAPMLSMISSAEPAANQSRADITGPEHTPDGKPDTIISVHTPAWILSQVASWDIECLDRPGHWTSAPNPSGWWPVAPVRASGGANSVDLHFPDSTDYVSSKRLRVTARDRESRILISLNVNR